MDSALLVEPLLVVTQLNLNQVVLLNVITKSLTDNPKFIKARFHISRFITAAVDTEAERANTEVLQTDLASASTRIAVNISSPYDSFMKPRCSKIKITNDTHL
jgi:hypothetical protein